MEVVRIVHPALGEPTEGLRDRVNDVVRSPIQRRANVIPTSSGKSE